VQKKFKPKPRADEVDKYVANNIKQLRLMNGYTQEYVANEVKVTFQQFQKYEKGINRISASRLYSLSKTLDVDVNEFFLGLDRKSENNNFSGQCSDLSRDKEAMELFKDFKNISDPKVKEAIIKMLKSVLKE